MEEELRLLIAKMPGMTVPVNWGWIKQGSIPPQITMNVVSDVGGFTLDGPDGRSTARVQIDVWSESYAEAKLLYRALRAGLNGYRGGRFQGVFQTATRDFHDTDEKVFPFRVSTDFMVHYER